MKRLRFIAGCAFVSLLAGAAALYAADTKPDPRAAKRPSIPPHTGEASLIFDLHNRHTYSEEEVKAGRGFATHQAVIGALTMKGELLERGAVQSEFRTAADLYERIGGGAGPGGAKAVAPIGREEVIIPVPAGVDQVSLLGEVLNSTSSPNASRYAFVAS